MLGGTVSQHGTSQNTESERNAEGQVALVLRYFAAVDSEDLQGILDTLTETCRFTVETHGVVLTGRDEIAAMFKRLWSNHKSVKHHQFRFVPDPPGGRVVAQFQVENTEHDGSLTHKSNCNVFDIHDGLFSQISVYMAGPNTLNKD